MRVVEGAADGAKTNRQGRAEEGGGRIGSNTRASRQKKPRRAHTAGRSTRRRSTKAPSPSPASAKPTTRRRAAAAKPASAARPRRRAAAAKPRRRAAAAKSRPKQRHTAGHGKRATEALVSEIKQYYDAGGFLSWSAAAKKFVILGTNEPKGGLVACPECGLGQLMVVRSRATRKRFIGCSNYYGGCDASSPLLQRARLRALKRPCPSCAWPMVIFRYSRNEKWTRQCSNVRCPARAAPAQS